MSFLSKIFKPAKGDRKYTYAMHVLYLATGLAMIGKLSGVEYAGLISSAMLFFGAANAATHFADKRAEGL